MAFVPRFQQWKRAWKSQMIHINILGNRRMMRQSIQRVHPVVITLAVGLIGASVVVNTLETRMRPVLNNAAQSQVHNQMISVLEHAVLTALSDSNAGKSGFISIQRDENGNITDLTTNVAALNLLRSRVVDQVLLELQGVDVSNIELPLGSLWDSELIWARGPAIRAHAMTVGTISAEFQSDFISAGVNQTIHQIWLELSVPLTVMLAGRDIAVPISSRICIAETIVVGKVPNTYFQSIQS